MERMDQFPMLVALHAGGPAPDWADQMMLYGQFIGSWEGRVVLHRPDGNRREADCEVHFDWVLEGRAVQDVWIAPTRRASREAGQAPHGAMYGTTLRVYDPQSDLWHITWIDPGLQDIRRMIGRKVGQDIVQEYTDDEGVLCQWCFTEITADYFHWLWRETQDGETWDVKTEFFLERSSPDS